jgi:protein disulfide-isomerase A6
MSSFLVLFLIICVISCAFADVINLSQDTFSSHVNGDTNALVEFYAPWCGHCKTLAPEWQIAGKTFKPSDDIIITAVDATESPDLAQSYGIQGYPTIKFFPKGSTEPEDYTGGRTADKIVSWVNDKIGTRRKLSKGPPSAIVTLTTDNFEQHVFGSKNALVEFYAPWCGHCKTLAPKYEILANVFAGDKNVLIGQVDATDHGDLATKFDVGGYPTLKFFPSGQSEPVNYEDAREVEDMVTFINRHAGKFIYLSFTIIFIYLYNIYLLL